MRYAAGSANSQTTCQRRLKEGTAISGVIPAQPFKMAESNLRLTPKGFGRLRDREAERLKTKSFDNLSREIPPTGSGWIVHSRPTPKAAAHFFLFPLLLLSPRAARGEKEKREKRRSGSVRL